MTTDLPHRPNLYPILTMHEALRDRLLERWARLVTRRPVMTLTCCLMLAAIGITLAATYLTFNSERSDLVDPDLPWNARYADYKLNYPRWSDLVVAIEGEAGDTAIDALAGEVSEAIAALPNVAHADGGFDTLDHPRMFRLEPSSGDGFRTALDGLWSLKRLAAATDVNAALMTLLHAQAGQDATDRSIKELDILLRPYLRAAVGETAAFQLPGLTGSGWRPFTTPSGRIRLIHVSMAGPDGSASGQGTLITDIRRAASSVLEGHAVEWGVTGIDAIEADETSQSIADSTRASIVALVLITMLVLVVFRGFRVPLFAVIALLIGLCWSVGWLVVSVGHLQLLSVVFGVVLLGLGIDFALHIIARLELIHGDCDSFEEAITRTFQAVGPGLLTGAITTAAAFGAIALTDFRGAAELGVISAGGILLCLVAVMCALPAMLCTFGDWRRSIRTRPGDISRSTLARPLFFVSSHSGITLTVSVITTSILAWSALQVRYDPNILNLHPPGIESVEWENRLIADQGQSAWAGLSVVDPEEAEQRVAALRDLAGVADVGGMGLFFPHDLADRQAAIAEIRDEEVVFPETARGQDGLLATLRQILFGLRLQRLDEAVDARALSERISATIEEASKTDASARAAAWQALDASFVEQRDELGAFVEAALSPAPLRADDLPPALRQSWIGRDGSWLLRVEPTAGDGAVLAPERLGAFVETMRTVDPNIIGPPVQIHESSLLIQSAYIKAALLVLPAILIVLLIDFRSVPDALLAVLPVVIGFVGAFGIMSIAGVPLNFANMIVMPIILGIGVDAGVHVVHRWRADGTGLPPGLSGGTGRSISLTMLTTMIGFGCMMLAEHRGIRSLGFVMVIGLGVTLVACLTTLPAALALRRTQPAQAPGSSGAS